MKYQKQWIWVAIRTNQMRKDDALGNMVTTKRRGKKHFHFEAHLLYLWLKCTQSISEEVQMKNHASDIMQSHVRYSVCSSCDFHKHHGSIKGVWYYAESAPLEKRLLLDLLTWKCMQYLEPQATWRTVAKMAWTIASFSCIWTSREMGRCKNTLTCLFVVCH